MLVIRMQRTGRKGHAQFRVVVQDSRRTPTSGRVVAALGSLNPHTKETILDKEKASFYLEHGAQPSERVIRLLKAEGVKLPTWVTVPEKKKSDVRNPEKRRSTAPPAPKEEAPVEAAAEPATETVEPAAEPEVAVVEPVAEAAESTDAEPAPVDAVIEEAPIEDPAEAATEAADTVEAEETPTETA